MSLEEARTAKTPLASTFEAGLATLSLDQTVNFTLYIKLIFPLDGYIFWVNSNLLTNTAIFNASRYAEIEFGSVDNLPNLPKAIAVQGSLHYATEQIQNDDDVGARNRVVFTTQQQIQDFNLINPNFIYIATFDEVRFAFSRNHNFYKQALVYHYHGDAIYSTMQTQIIDNLSDIDLNRVIVSNSLPLWLSLDHYFPVYPSFLSPLNSNLPYATIYIDPRQTTGLQSAPLLSDTSSHYQLAKDTVKIQIYGIRNNIALEYHDYLLNYSLLTDNFGLMNTPIMQDEHVLQKELGIIAIKKTIVFDISYYQKNILDIARQYILEAFVTLYPQENPP